MARKSRTKKRIEPRLSDKAEDDMRAPSSERVGAEPKKRRKSKKSGPAPRKRFWLFRFIAWLFRPAPRLVYWSVVVGLWACIAVGGIVAYYAAQLPSADDWVIPERPPNMRILAADKSMIGNRGLTGGKALRLEDMSPYIA